MLIKKNFHLLSDMVSLLAKGGVVSDKQMPRFVFLCGANKPEGGISARRQAILDFGKANIQNVEFVLAEKFFRALDDSHVKNLLDLEDEISNFCNDILIILESESTFAELGAFASPKLRDKLIVINNERFRKSESFINLGPIKAIKDPKKIIYYEMTERSYSKIDGMGSIFHKIYDLLENNSSHSIKYLGATEVSPSAFNKIALSFLHDIVYIAGPLKFSEIIDIYKFLLPHEKSFDKVKTLLSILCSYDAAWHTQSTDGKKIYHTTSNKPFLSYRGNFDLNLAVANFRHYHFKYNKGRISV